MNTQIVATPNGSPFDGIRKVRFDGTEYWSARELMPLMAYSTWQNFMPVIQRASQAAENQGYALDQLFMTSHEKSGGRPREDVHLSRLASYLVAMNGDPRIPEVAAAQAYFAIQTRVAETAPRPLSLAERSRQVIGELDSMVQEQRRELEVARPKVAAWDSIVSSAGSWSYNDAAKVLCEEGQIQIGEKRLVNLLVDWGHLYRDHKGRPHVFQRHLEKGWFAVKARTYEDKQTGEIKESSAPQVRITGKGLDMIRHRLTNETNAKEAA